MGVVPLSATAMGTFSWIILGLIAGFIASMIVDKQGQGGHQEIKPR